MKKATVFAIAAITVDGLIAKHHEQFADWSSKEDKQLFKNLTTQAGVMVMGNTTFKTFPKPLPGRKHVVYTRRVDQFVSSPQVAATNMEPAELIKSLTNEGFERIAIIGGQKIYNLFLINRLVDEIYLVVEPIIFGDGVKLIDKAGLIELALLDTKKLNENTIMLHYQVRK